MSAKRILQKLKRFLGLSGGERERDRRRSGPGNDASVTVEREPDTASEDAVKGTTTGGSRTGSSGDGQEAGGGTAGTDAGSDAAEQGQTESIEGVKGIGPTYRDRLEAAGIETVADLAASDPETVAEAAQTSESRAGNWVERAQNR